jgi:hypothetical protein
VLRSFRELEKFRARAVDGRACGRIRDIYFDDQTWAIRQLVVSIEPRQFGRKEVLVEPRDVFAVCDAEVQLKTSWENLDAAPLATSILPVCKQYASMAFSSPGSSFLARGAAGSDPYLRSAKAVTNYAINLGGKFAGVLANFIFDDLSWEIRYLGIEQRIEHKKLQFHIVPQAVERFTWATQRVLLRELQPVALEPEQVVVPLAAA